MGLTNVPWRGGGVRLVCYIRVFLRIFKSEFLIQVLISRLYDVRCMLHVAGVAFETFSL